MHVSVGGGSELFWKESAPFVGGSSHLGFCLRGQAGKKCLITQLYFLSHPVSNLYLSVNFLPSLEYIYHYSVLGCPRRCVEYIRVTNREKNVFFCCNESYCNSVSVKDEVPFNPIQLENLEFN